MDKDVHQHCENCFKFNCTSTKTCKMVFCRLGCGFRMHECKCGDHVFVCCKEIISCPSAVYGCPVRLQRARLSKHLVVCPASVVFCTMEWNRYPLYSKSRLSWVPFFQPNPVLVKGHLDVELALRDQKVLQDMSKKRLRKGKAKVDILRLNNTSPDGKDIRDKRHFDNSEVDMAIALSALEHKLKPLKLRSEAPEGNSNAMNCSLKVKTKEEEKQAILKDMESKSEALRSDDRRAAVLCENTSLSTETTSNHESKTAESQLRVNDQNLGSGTPMNTHNTSNEVVAEAIPGKEIANTREILRLCLENNKENLKSTSTENGIKDNQNKPIHSRINESSNADINESSSQPDPDLPLAPTFADIYLVEPLGLNVMLETLPKFQKQTPLYSIPCNQVFRRNEYGAHFKNVHSEIHGGLNGWVEHRCPLAQYGCTFIHHRLLPNDQCGRVTFNKELGSFGVRNDMPNEQDDASDETRHISMEMDTDYLSHLPVEILENIAGMLDGFSLCHFSCTSKLLRDVSQHMLVRKGLVILEWEKRIYDNGTWSWQVRQKKWFFSTSFSPVKNWVHSNKPGMASHLEKCPFFEHYVPAEKFRYQEVESDLEDDESRGLDIEEHWQELREIAGMY